MAHIDSIGAAIFSDLSVGIYQTMPSAYDKDTLAAYFATKTTAADATPAVGEFVRMPDVREFPAMGTPPNIVKVPVYGQKVSQSIQGQADAPQLELTLNFVPSDWDSATGFGKFVNDGVKRVFRFTLLNEDPGAAATWASTTAGFGGKKHTCFYWIGKIEAIQVKPSLSDSTTATVTLSIQSDFYGAFTHV